MGKRKKKKQKNKNNNIPLCKQNKSAPAITVVKQRKNADHSMAYGLYSQTKKDKIEKFVKVSDDWYDNYPGDTVKVFMFNQYNSPGKQFDFARIAVKGDDEFGMYMDFRGIDQEATDAKFNEWKEEIYDKLPEVVNVKYFRDLGFKFY